jgi:hypothetical protein
MICCLSREGMRDRLLEPPVDPSGISMSFGWTVVDEQQNLLVK